MTPTEWWAACLAAVAVGERAWRLSVVTAFFRRPTPEPARSVRLVSVLQPILSGDPTLPVCLAENLAARHACPVEWLYLIDEEDADAREFARFLAAAFPERTLRVLLCPPAPDGVNPKTWKLLVGAREARGGVLCVLDDDTVLPDGGLETCLPFLDAPGVGLAFGLPYYRHFDNVWSGLVSAFVNATGLLTYVPYTRLTEPFTVNGMFYLTRRETLDAVGGFDGLEGALADDFAVAERFRKAGYRLAQTPLRHGIRTHVRDARRYSALMRRWFTFPRESLLRRLSGKDRAVLLTLGLVVNVLPVGPAALALLRPSPVTVAATLLWAVHATLVAAALNRRHLQNATPPGWVLLTPLVLLLFPVQMLAALLSPTRRIVWRGKVMEARRGGGFRSVPPDPPGDA